MAETARYRVNSEEPWCDRDRMASGQQYELIAPSGKELVGLHEQPADPLIDDGRERRVKLTIGGDGEDAHVLTEFVDGGLYIAHL
jgi:hypothetical protein